MIARPIRFLIALSLAAAACAQPATQPGGVSPSDPPLQGTPAPWLGAPLPASGVPPVYFQQWDRAANRASCALIVFAEPGTAGQGATPRAATFSGGWAVAYDLPNLRSAFGVAGAGVSASEPAYDEWPYRMHWADGSTAGYGPEGGTGPNLLAYLRITGQDCLYNVWSRLGRAHLEQLLTSLRFVSGR
ncbi:MAG TPA: hypothetical protein VFZ04_05070 [Longimicrobiales bacterium]